MQLHADVVEMTQLFEVMHGYLTVLSEHALPEGKMEASVHDIDS